MNEPIITMIITSIACIFALLGLVVHHLWIKKLEKDYSKYKAEKILEINKNGNRKL